MLVGVQQTEQESPHTSRSGRRRWWPGTLLVAVVALGIGLAACGGGSPKTSANAGCTPTGCSNPGAAASMEAKAVKYAGCMRSHGVSQFPDPTVGPNGLPTFTINSSPTLNPGSPAFRAAKQTCKMDLPNLGPQTPAETAAANAKALRYATCMRSNGVS